MYIFNFVQINNSTVQITESTQIKNLQRNTYVIGWLLFGNLADNAFDPKLYLVVCCAAIGFYYIILGAYIEWSSHSVDQIDTTIIYATDSVMFLFAGVSAFSMVQLFNWFPAKFRGTIMALLQTAETLGFVSQFFSSTWWPYFPFVPYSNADLLDAFGLRHIIMGSLLLLIAVIDHFSFYNYPMQRSIIMARTERSYSEYN